MKLLAVCDGAGCTTPPTEVNSNIMKPNGWTSIIVETGLNRSSATIVLCPECYSKTPMAQPPPPVTPTNIVVPNAP